MDQLKEIFQTPEMEIIRFESVDIITTSGVLDEDELPPVIIR